MRTFLTPPPGFDGTAFAKEASRAVGLPIPESDLPEVATNLERTAGFAQLLADLPDLDLVEPAPVFRPAEAKT